MRKRKAQATSHPKILKYCANNKPKKLVERKKIFQKQWKITRLVLLQNEISEAMIQANTYHFASYTWIT